MRVVLAGDIGVGWCWCGWVDRAAVRVGRVWARVAYLLSACWF